MKVYDFTVPELNYFRTYCNFTDEERALFEYRAKNYPLEYCAELMNVSVSTAKRLSRKVNNKIIRYVNKKVNHMIYGWEKGLRYVCQN